MDPAALAWATEGSFPGVAGDRFLPPPPTPPRPLPLSYETDRDPPGTGQMLSNRGAIRPQILSDRGALMYSASEELKHFKNAAICMGASEEMVKEVHIRGSQRRQKTT